MKICMFEIALERGRVEDNSDQATGFVSMIMLKSDDGVAVSNLSAKFPSHSSFDPKPFVLSFWRSVASMLSMLVVQPNKIHGGPPVSI